MIAMEIDIRAVPQARARSGNNGFYTPKKSAEFKEALIGWYEWYLSRWEKENGEWGLNPNEAYGLKVDFYFKKPKANKKPYHTQKPDLDNLYKAITDAMNGIFFVDDSQLVDSRMVKHWSSERDSIIIKLWLIGGEE